MPVLVARNAQGRLGAFLNLCRHKGAPVASNEGPYKLQSEVCLHATYREWARLMKAGLGGTPAYPGSA